MRNKLLLYILLFLSGSLSAQTIEITSFMRDHAELEIQARKEYQLSEKEVTDYNGNPCALVKIERADNMPPSMLKNLEAEGSGQFLRPKYIAGEGLYFYISYNTDKIKIVDKTNRLQHQSNSISLKKYFEYTFLKTGSKGLDPNAVYYMTISFKGSKKRSGKNCHVTFNVTPKDADIYIDGEKEGKGSYALNMKSDWLTVKATKANYYDEERNIDITNDTTININLRPITGRLNLTTVPSNATVKITRLTQESSSAKTPLDTTLTIGEYAFELPKVKITQPTQESFTAKTPLDTTLMIGEYAFELSNANCLTHKGTLTIQENAEHPLAHNFQTNETVYISSNPEGAKVSINGNPMAQTTPLEYVMNYGQTYTITAQKFGGEQTQEIHFTPSTNPKIHFEIQPKLKISPEDCNFSEFGGEKYLTIETPFTNWSYSSNAKWFDVKRHDKGLTITTDRNKKYNKRYGTIHITAANKTQAIPVVQEPKFRKSTDLFSDFFLEYTLGYQTKAKKATLGFNFAYLAEGAGGHLGFYLNPNYGFDKSFIGATGMVTRWTHSSSGNFDFQFYGGIAYLKRWSNELSYNENFVPGASSYTSNGASSQWGGDIGIRFTGKDPERSRFGFFSATLGAKIFKDEVIPTIGLSTGMFGSALIFREDRFLEAVDDYQQWFLEFIGGYGFDTGYWGVGGTLAYVPSSMGGYFSGMGGEELLSFSGGPIFRVIPEDWYYSFDLQVYTGVGYNSVFAKNLAFDTGLRLTGAFDWWGKFSKLSATLGTQVSLEGKLIPTVGISLGLTLDIIGGWMFYD